jgi:hypothetical protein
MNRSATCSAVIPDTESDESSSYAVEEVFRIEEMMDGERPGLRELGRSVILICAWDL